MLYLIIWYHMIVYHIIARERILWPSICARGLPWATRSHRTGHLDVYGEVQGAVLHQSSMEGGKAEGLRAARPFGETVQRSTLYIDHDEAGSIHCLLCCKYRQRKHLASTAHAKASLGLLMNPGEHYWPPLHALEPRGSAWDIGAPVWVPRRMVSSM